MHQSQHKFHIHPQYITALSINSITKTQTNIVQGQRIRLYHDQDHCHQHRIISVVVIIIVDGHPK